MKSGKYFDGTLADDDTSLCFVGFNTLKQQEMATNKDANVAITLNNCMIQKAKFGEQWWSQTQQKLRCHQGSLQTQLY